MLVRSARMIFLVVLAVLTTLIGGQGGATAADPCVPTMSTLGMDVVLVFDDTSAQGCEWTPPLWVTSARVLVVGAGGGGGVNGRGGGGGGGVIDDTNVTMTPGIPVTIVVGAGGSGAYYGPNYSGYNDPQDANTIPATSGGNSTFSSITALGGGFGSGTQAGNGGSGGGSTGGAGKQGLGTAGQGSDGSPAGGGGGAGSPAPTGDTGGPGKSSDITGAVIDYGGGGGRGYCCQATGASAADGGGRGGSNAYAPDPGTDGLGGGGGGGGSFPDYQAGRPNDKSVGGVGGSGIVIVRYRDRLAQTISVSSSPDPVIAGSQAALTASGYTGIGAITFTVINGATQCTVTGSTLTALRAGTCEVTAAIAMDDTYLGATSSPLTVTVSPPPPPPPSPPQAPWLVEAVPGNGRVTLTWAKPDWEGTSPVTAYIATATPGGQTCSAAAASQPRFSCTIEGLTNGQPYAFTVKASNSVGDSPPSRSLTATPLADAPGAPVLTSVTARNKTAVITWDPPTSDGGSPVTEYRVTSSTGTEVCSVSASAGPPFTCTVSGLTNERYYSFWITAVNAAGVSPRSNVTGVKVTPALPGKPRDVEGTAGDKRIYVAWRPPEDAGDAPVDRYEVGVVYGGRTCVVTPPETACMIPGLTAGTTYITRVRARSSVGWGPWAFSAPILVPAKPPPGISVEVRRLPKDPDEVIVTGRTTGIRTGTALWVWIHRMTDGGYMESFQGSSRPVVQDDGTFTWERRASANRVWEVIWCTEPGVQGICSRWTLLAG